MTNKNKTGWEPVKPSTAPGTPIRKAFHTPKSKSSINGQLAKPKESNPPRESKAATKKK